MQFGVGMLASKPFQDMVKLATLAEEKAYDFVWVADATPFDYRIYRDPYSILAVWSLKTKRIKLGLGVTNPYTRHPAVTAAAIATIQEISGGRAVLGIGASAKTILDPLGLEWKKRAAACSEAIQVIRRLLVGERVRYKGKTITLDGTKLDFQLKEGDLPIYLACRAPKTLLAAGELADGAIIGSIKSIDGLTYAITQIERGAKKAGRDLSKIEIVDWVTCSISDDGKTAKDVARPGVAARIGAGDGLGLTPYVLETLGVSAQTYGPIREAWKQGNYQKAERLVNNELLKDWTLAGTPSECVTEINELENVGVTQVSILPTKELEATIRKFGEEVIPSFR